MSEETEDLPHTQRGRAVYYAIRALMFVGGVVLAGWVIGSYSEFLLRAMASFVGALCGLLLSGWWISGGRTRLMRWLDTL